MKVLMSLRMYDGGVRTTAKQTFLNKWLYENVVLYLLSYEFNTV
jgi:hypothetical protein